MEAVNPKLARKAGHLALKHAKEFDKFSRLFDAHPIPQLEWNDVQIGDLLGQGAFSSVYDVKVPQLGSSHSQHEKNKEEYPKLIRRQNKKINAQPNEYAIKMVRKKCKPDKHFLKISAISIVLEAKILASIQHENIIKLHGVKGGCISKSFSQEGGYFLVLERVYGTLDDKLLKWKKHEKKNVLVRLLKKKHYHVPTLLERIKSIALGVARGMEYLHSINILYRDLKPQNIGFDSKGEVVLFDFGIAQELDPGLDSVTCKGGRRLTQQVGTFRYMAPENYNSQSYGLPSDVYSFGMLLYAICTLETPFSTYSTTQLQQDVICGNQRPSLKHECLADSPELVQLIKECWDPAPEQRPTFTEICAMLREFVLSASNMKCQQ